MTYYDFEGPNGQRVEREFQIGTAPQSISIDGVTYKRALSVPTVVIGGRVSGKDVRFVSHSLGDRFNKYHNGEFANSYGTKVPAFTSVKQRDEFQRRVNADGHKLCYGKSGAGGDAE